MVTTTFEKDMKGRRQAASILVRKERWKHFEQWASAKSQNYVVRALMDTLVAFCTDTTLHGVHYILSGFQDLKKAHTKAKRIQRLGSIIIWTSACLIGVAFAVVLMHLIWIRFQKTPTITTVETTNYPIWNVPFPAVTVCNINKVYAPSAQNLTDKLISRGMSKGRIKGFFGALGRLIKPEYVDDHYKGVFEILESMGYTTETLMYELAQPCESLLKKCLWLGKVVSCETLFRMAKSSEGYCCSFNYKALKFSLELEMDEATAEQRSNPIYRVAGAGEYVGLSIIIDVETEHYLSTVKPFFGAEVLIHDSWDFPEASVAASIVQPGKDVTISVIPSVVVSETQIRNLDVSQRQCWFKDEMKLRTTNSYSFQSCISECAVDTIIAVCECLPFLYPESNMAVYRNKYRQCNFRDIECLRNNRHIFASLEPSEELRADNESRMGMDCDCLPSCTDLRYESLAIVADRMTNETLPSQRYGFIVPPQMSTFRVSFKDLTCIKYRRDMYMTWDGLFASFGGIFGLCLGGSVISLVELVYFFTFKLFNKILTYRSQQKISRDLNFNKTKFIAPLETNRISIIAPFNNGDKFLW